jgi:transcriptional regulator with XRE-family HTH domain
MGKKIKPKNRIGFPGILKITRYICCFTQEETAKFIGIPYNTYKTYESGRSIPSVETLRKIAIAFDVSTDWLLELTDSMQPDNRIQHIGSDELDTVQARLLEVEHRFSDKAWKDRLEKETGGIDGLARAYKRYLKALNDVEKTKKNPDKSPK